MININRPFATNTSYSFVILDLQLNQVLELVTSFAEIAKLGYVIEISKPKFEEYTLRISYNVSVDPEINLHSINAAYNMAISYLKDKQFVIRSI